MPELLCPGLFDLCMKSADKPWHALNSLYHAHVRFCLHPFSPLTWIHPSPISHSCLPIFFSLHLSSPLSSLQVRQRNELGIYLINLSVADLLYITTLPLWIDYFLQHDDWIHGQESCKLFGFIFYTNIYVSIAFLCCISLDRYLAVAYPLRFAKVRRIKTGTKG